MWTRGAAIRPVPRYAVVSAALLEQIEEHEDWDDESGINERISRLPNQQPVLYEDILDRRNARIDDVAKSFHLTVTSRLVQIFEAAFPGRVSAVATQDLVVIDQSLNIEEELRAAHPEEPFDLDDVVSREQPAIVTFLQRVLEETLESVSDRDVDLDDVHAVYRKILGYVLALSHAVASPDGRAPKEKTLS
ncbi:MAG: hypothetical protein ABI461_09715 [Polyangiaceae bacterium]